MTTFQNGVGDSVNFLTLSSQRDHTGQPVNIDLELAPFNKDVDWLNNPNAGLFFSVDITPTEFNTTVKAAADQGGITIENWKDWYNAQIQLMAADFGGFERIPKNTLISVENKFRVLAGQGPLFAHTAFGTDPNENFVPAMQPFSFAGLTEGIRSTFGNIADTARGVVSGIPIVAGAVIVVGAIILLKK